MLWERWKKNNRPLVERQEKAYYGIKALVVSSQEWERQEEVKAKKVRKYPLWVNREEREIRQQKFKN